MKMSKIGHRLMGLAVAGAALAAGGVAFAELGQRKLRGDRAEELEQSDRALEHDRRRRFKEPERPRIFSRPAHDLQHRRREIDPRTVVGEGKLQAWTLIPVLILVAIAIPSFKLLFLQLDIPKADLTIKATGKQWYWTYSYPDNGKFEFDSLLVQDKKPRLLGVDNEMVVPVNKVIRVQTTGADVIHAFAVPAFGIKIDSIPGRLNETWFKATKTGMFYGQCSELCGKDHAFMPIEVHVVSEQDYATWLADAKKKWAMDNSAPANAVAAKQ